MKMVKKNVKNGEAGTDEELVMQIRGGNYDRLPFLIDRYLPRILFYAEKYCRESDREDAIQEATIALYTAVREYDPAKSSFATFASLCLERSVITAARASLRKKRVPDELISSIEEVEISDQKSPEQILLEKERLQDLTDTIRVELSGLEYRVLELFLAGKRYAQIAEDLGITEKAVDNSLVRIRKKLRK